MKEVGKEPAEIEPLVVRNLDINNLSGNLHDSDSFTGKGNLNFINSFKREHTVFDIPADFLGRIFGLDLELLIPVIGEIDFEIEEGKAVLTDLKESFSQNRRSKFFLFEKNEAPYMDFDGNLNVNIKMKQFVLFKITEHFIIKINGSLMNPTFSLKRKKSFFSSWIRYPLSFLADASLAIRWQKGSFVPSVRAKFNWSIPLPDVNIVLFPQINAAAKRELPT